MNWYQGNIAEAVALSKTRNAIFVVYVEGELKKKEKNEKKVAASRNLKRTRHLKH